MSELLNRFVRARAAGALVGLCFLLPALPALWAYAGSAHLGFAVYNLNKFLLSAGLVFVLLRFPARPEIRRPRLALWLLLQGLAAWSLAAGFSVYAVFLSIVALTCLAADQGFTRTQAAALVLIFAVALLPVMHLDAVRLQRDASISGVDFTLRILGVPFERVGITYMLSLAGGAEAIPVEEKCSGASTARVLLVVFGFLALRRAPGWRLWIAVPVLAVGLATVANILRISAHLLISRVTGSVPGPSVHELIGLAVIIAILTPMLWWELRRPGQMRISSAQNAPQISWPPVRARFAVGVASTLSAFAMLVQGGATKRVDTDFRQGLGQSGAWPIWEHVNHVTEHAGGGGWIVLEHPIEYCFAVRGLDMDAWRANSNRAGRRIEIHSRYRLANESYSRLGALARKWADPRVWRTPVHVEVRVLERLL